MNFAGSNRRFFKILNNIYCLDAETGELIWNYETGDFVCSSPAVADGKVFVGSGDNKIYCLDEDTGELIWSYETGGFVYSSPAVADGKVFVGSRDNKIYCFGSPTPPPFASVPPLYTIGAALSIILLIFVGPMTIAYLTASFINEVLLRRGNNKKLYITIAFIFAFMSFLLFPPIQDFAAEDALLFLAAVLVLGIGAIFSMAYLIQQKYRAKISDEARVFLGVIVASVLNFARIFLNPVAGVIWWPYLVNTEIWMTSIEKYAIESWLLVAVWMWTFIGLKSKYWRVFVGYILFMNLVPTLSVVAFLIAIKRSFDQLFLEELVFTGRYLVDFVSFGLLAFIILLIGIYIADKTGFIKRVKEHFNTTFQKKERGAEAYGEKRYEDYYKREKKVKTESIPYYYRVLGVSKTATPEEIKGTYRRLAKMYHPDVSVDPDTEKKFKEIQKAFETLSDPIKRAQYDRFESTIKNN